MDRPSSPKPWVLTTPLRAQCMARRHLCEWSALATGLGFDPVPLEANRRTVDICPSMRRPVESREFFCFFVGHDFSPAKSPLSPPFHPHSGMSDFVSLGASWVFSFQSVLPPVSRPHVPSWDGSRARP